jgi:hypothetical protein
MIVPKSNRTGLSDILVCGVRGSVRAIALSASVGLLIGLSAPTVLLVSAMSLAMMSSLIWIVVSRWESGSERWIMSSMVAMTALNTMYALAMILLNSAEQGGVPGFSWYNNETMFFGSMAVWLSLLIILKSTLDRLNKEVPI